MNQKLQKLKKKVEAIVAARYEDGFIPSLVLVVGLCIALLGVVMIWDSMFAYVPYVPEP
jgi:hypothetical protein